VFIIKIILNHEVPVGMGLGQQPRIAFITKPSGS